MGGEGSRKSHLTDETTDIFRNLTLSTRLKTYQIQSCIIHTNGTFGIGVMR